MKNQKGLTLTGMLIVSILVVMVLLLGFKVVPVYLEYMAINKQMQTMADDPTLRAVRGRGELDRSWAARTTVEDIKHMPPENVEYTKEGDRWFIHGSYSVKVPLFKNTSVCFDFEPSSKK